MLFCFMCLVTPGEHHRRGCLANATRAELNTVTALALGAVAVWRWWPW